MRKQGFDGTKVLNLYDKVTGIFNEIFDSRLLTASLFARTFRGIILLSAVFGYTGCLCGLWLSALIGVPSGAAIILSAITLYFLCRAIK